MGRGTLGWRALSESPEEFNSYPVTMRSVPHAWGSVTDSEKRELKEREGRGTVSN